MISPSPARAPRRRHRDTPTDSLTWNRSCRRPLVGFGGLCKSSSEHLSGRAGFDTAGIQSLLSNYSRPLSSMSSCASLLLHRWPDSRRHFQRRKLVRRVLSRRGLHSRSGIGSSDENGGRAWTAVADSDRRRDGGGDRDKRLSVGGFID